MGGGRAMLAVWWRKEVACYHSCTEGFAGCRPLSLRRHPTRYSHEGHCLRELAGVGPLSWWEQAERLLRCVA